MKIGQLPKKPRELADLTHISRIPIEERVQQLDEEGELVPKPTTVSPMTNGDRPSAAAKREAPLTRASAPTIKQTSPAMNKTITMAI